MKRLASCVTGSKPLHCGSGKYFLMRHGNTLQHHAIHCNILQCVAVMFKALMRHDTFVYEKMLIRAV
jgi:hypothetical protein